MNNVVEIKNLSKSFLTVKAVDDISFTVPRGSFLAFLGLNGAGKSTTINIISTTLRKDSGTVVIDGHDLDSEPSLIREKIGLVFQNSILDQKLTVFDNLTIRASFYGLSGRLWKERYAELSKLLGLDDIKNRLICKLSGGQRRRVDIARALINAPQVLILDEPTTGLDPQTRKTVWDIIDGLRKTHGMTVFFSTHYMEEANEADDVIIIDSGRIVAHGTPLELKNQYSSDYIKIYCEQSAPMDSLLSVYNPRYEGTCYKVPVKGGKMAKDFVIAHQDVLDNFEIVKGDMDDVFLQVTGKKLQGEAK